MVVDENMSVIHIIGSLHWERTQLESNIMETIRHIPISLISYGGSVIVSQYQFTRLIRSNYSIRCHSVFLKDFQPD